MTKVFINNDIIHTKDINFELKNILNQNSYSKVLLLTDNNCIEQCFPIIKKTFKSNLPIFVTNDGEENKSLHSLSEIWKFLIENEADRNSLLINLGGGIITDIGGFAASTFKRGIDFINIPTTLLAQIDASVGGKTGINFGGFKNEIGVINQAKKVLIDARFLITLSKKEFLSGFSEMIKHSIIFDKSHFYELKDFYYNEFLNGNLVNIDSLILKSVKIKEYFVMNDVADKGIRQTLNFGHTFGHAFESFFYSNKQKKIKHGEAVAFGMLCELFISTKRCNFSYDYLNIITEFIKDIFGELKIKKINYNDIYNFMLHDKKNISQKIKCVLLEDFGKPKIGKFLCKDEVFNALEYFRL